MPYPLPNRHRRHPAPDVPPRLAASPWRASPPPVAASADIDRGFVKDANMRLRTADDSAPPVDHRRISATCRPRHACVVDAARSHLRITTRSSACASTAHGRVTPRITRAARSTRVGHPLALARQPSPLDGRRILYSSGYACPSSPSCCRPRSPLHRRRIASTPAAHVRHGRPQALVGRPSVARVCSLRRLSRPRTSRTCCDSSTSTGRDSRALSQRRGRLSSTARSRRATSLALPVAGATVLYASRGYARHRLAPRLCGPLRAACTGRSWSPAAPQRGLPSRRQPRHLASRGLDRDRRRSAKLRALAIRWRVIRFRPAPSVITPRSAKSPRPCGDLLRLRRPPFASSTARSLRRTA